MKKLILITLSVILLEGCREHINHYHGYIVLQQHCGFDDFDGGSYVLENPKTKERVAIDVDIRWCHVYSKGDTIK